MSTFAQQPSKIVQISSGPIQGKTYKFDNGFTASAYLGIPYGKEPSGELRFKKPVSPDNWLKIRQCTEFSTSFPHVPSDSVPDIKMGEDSLCLNVFVPEKAGQKLPVLLFIHGGGFAIGSTTTTGNETICQHLCSKDIVVITINFRLGILGFLSLDDGQTDGNYGFWDMALAIRWTRDNISFFGGDPDRITLSGHSTGATAVDLLSLSPVTRDLFSQAIILSGTSNCEYLDMNPTLLRTILIEYAKHLGAEITGKTKKEVNRQVLEFYKKCDASKLALGVKPDSSFKYYPDFRIPILPCYDRELFPKPLEELRKEAPNKAVINGVTQYEGLGFTALKTAKKMTFEELVIYGLHELRPDLPPEVCQKVCLEAIGCEAKGYNYVVKCVEIISDYFINAGSLEMSRWRHRHGDQVYNFIFGYYKKGSLGAMSSLVSFEAATHCMELPYFLGVNVFGEFMAEKQDRNMIARFTTYLTSFVKTGCPNNDVFPEQWEEFNDEEHGYFLFGQNEFGMRKGSGERATRWNTFFKEYPRQDHSGN